MSATGPNSALTDVAGLLVGHYTDRTAVSGATVVLAPEGAVAAVDVRGAAPGTRETDLLSPGNLVDKAQAVCLSGGSVYGLAAADGVVRWLSRKGWGFPLEQNQVAPIVPAAVLYDLGRGEQFIPPVDSHWGEEACSVAAAGPVASGSVGAGTGALAGGIKGGVGTASRVLDSGIVVAALAAVNSLGSVVDPATGRLWEIGLEQDDELGPAGRRAVVVPPPGQAGAGAHTTIGVVATDAALSKAQARKVAQMAHDGLARAVRPAHTLFDGDTFFCLATGRRALPETPGFFAAPHAQALSEIGYTAADCVTRAIMRAIVDAESLAGMTAWSDLTEKG